jgi:hypothetical protein
MIGANYTDEQETVAMSDAERFKTLFNYHWHTTGRLMDGAAALGVGDYLDNPGYGHGSVHGLLFHLLQTMRSWRVGLVSGRQQSGIDPADYPDLPACGPASPRSRRPGTRCWPAGATRTSRPRSR